MAYMPTFAHEFQGVDKMHAPIEDKINNMSEYIIVLGNMIAVLGRAKKKIWLKLVG